MASNDAESLPVIVREPPVCYFITSDTRGLVLEVKGAGFKPKNYVVIGEKIPDSKGVNREHQFWYFERGEGQYFYIVSKLNGLVLDIKRHSHNRGTRLILFPRKPPPNNITNQLWKIERGYIIACLNQMVVSIKGEGGRGSGIAMYPRAEQNHQEWVFERVECNSVETPPIVDCDLNQAQDEHTHLIATSMDMLTDDKDEPEGEHIPLSEDNATDDSDDKPQGENIHD